MYGAAMQGAATDPIAMEWLNFLFANGGDLYADKPPFFFWLLATAMAVTGSMRIGFLLPSLLAGIGAMLLVYDLLRRARGREVALCGAFLLLLTSL